MSYHLLDLFSGIGGFALAARMAGVPIRNHFHSDIEPYANRVYAARFPDADQLGDVRKIDGRKLREENPGDWLVCGGFPCQDVSTAGKRKGLAGARSGLWYEMHRIIDELQPKYVLGENVAQLCFQGLDRVVLSLSEIGYDAEWQVISARAVGAPHLRERLWIVAYPQQDAAADADLHGLGLGLGQLPEGERDLGGCKVFGESTQGHPAWADWKGPLERREMASQPLIRRVDHGLSDRLDRSWADRGHALGNSIVPQVAEVIFRLILEAERRNGP